MNYQNMMSIETVFKLIREYNITLEEFNDWVSDQKEVSFSEGVHTGQGDLL